MQANIISEVISRCDTYKEFRRSFKKSALKPSEAVIILARHGQTDCTLSHTFQSYEPDKDKLTKLGERQAEQLKKAIEPFPVTKFVSSDLHRTYQMAEIIAPIEYVIVQKEPCLRDINYGRLGGLTYEGENNQFQKEYPELYATWKDDRQNFAAPEGESFRSFSRRVTEGFRAKILPLSLGHFSLVISHAATIREILKKEILDAAAASSVSLHYTSYKNSDCFHGIVGPPYSIKLPVDEASISVLHFTGNGQTKLLLFNNTEHLK